MQLDNQTRLDFESLLIFEDPELITHSPEFITLDNPVLVDCPSLPLDVDIGRNI